MIICVSMNKTNRAIVLAIVAWILFLSSNFTLASEKIPPLVISIPVDESVLIKTDPYFVLLKRAYKAIDVDVTFITMPGARSIRMLERGQVAGSYPRFEALLSDSPNLISIKNFVKTDLLFSYSLTQNKNDKKWHKTLLSTPGRIGSVRGIKVLEKKFQNKEISWFNHIDHLIGALKYGRITFAIDRPDVISRYDTPTLKIYQSSKPIFKGKITLLMHTKHQEVANKLEAHFITFNAFPINK